MVIINIVFGVGLCELGTVGQHPIGSHGCIHENENMCRVIASRDRYPLRVKAPLFFVIHMCPTVKTCDSVGRLAKPVVRSQNSLPTKRHIILNINYH